MGLMVSKNNDNEFVRVLKYYDGWIKKYVYDVWCPVNFNLPLNIQQFISLFQNTHHQLVTSNFKKIDPKNMPHWHEVSQDECKQLFP